MRDAAERQVVGLDPVRERQLAELRHQRPVAADDALHQPVMREPVEAALLAVAGRRREHQRQIARDAGLAKALLQRDQQLVRRADADEAGAQTVSPSRMMATASIG